MFDVGGWRLEAGGCYLLFVDYYSLFLIVIIYFGCCHSQADFFCRLYAICCVS